MCGICERIQMTRNDQDQKVILVIDTEKLNSEVRWEDGGGLDFPHIYGLLNPEAVTEVLDHLWSPEKEWIPNEELKKYAANGFRREWKKPQLPGLAEQGGPEK